MTVASCPERDSMLRTVTESPPLCPDCEQPASRALAGPEHDWECRNEACPEFGQAVRADEQLPPRDEPTTASDQPS